MRLGLRASVAPVLPSRSRPRPSLYSNREQLKWFAWRLSLFGHSIMGHQPFLVECPWRFLHQLQYFGLMDSPIGKSISSHQVG